MTSDTATSARGRAAAHPGDFPARSWRRVVGRVWAGIGRDRLSIIAAGVAFFATLAIFPAIAAMIALYGLVADPAQVADEPDGGRGRCCRTTSSR